MEAGGEGILALNTAAPICSFRALFRSVYKVY